MYLFFLFPADSFVNKGPPMRSARRTRSGNVRSLKIYFCHYFVRLREGASFAFGDMAAHLDVQQMARQYIPERLVVLDEMPRTPSGKIQKFRLREMAQVRKT